MILGVYAVGLLSDKPPENIVPVSSKEVKSHPSFDNTVPPTMNYDRKRKSRGKCIVCATNF